MNDILAGFMDFGAGAQLQETAGIGGDDGCRVRGFCVFHFSLQQIERGFRLRHVVDARGTAADIRVGQFHKFDAGDGAEQLARGFANFLAVEQVAGVLIGDAQSGFLHRCDKAESGEEFGDVAHFIAEGEGGGIFRLVGREEVIVFLERGAATRGVGDDGVKLGGGERGDVLAGKLAGRFANSSMSGKGTAAELLAGDDDFAAIGGEHADGGFIEFCESDVGDASRKKGDSSAAGALRRKSLAEFGEEEMVVDGGQEFFAIGEAEQFQDTGGACEPLQAGALIEAEQSGGQCNAFGMGKKVVEDKCARESREERTLILSFNAGAGVLDEFAVFHAGGAGGFTGAAIEAFINVVDETFGKRQFAVAHQNHLANAAAGRIGFELPEAVSWTVV